MTPPKKLGVNKRRRLENLDVNQIGRDGECAIVHGSAQGRIGGGGGGSIHRQVGW